ncbi:MAG: HDOD domain-containing protein [Leptospirales bacterium]|nr:HDOD domain-containing protein [Leptospirales bacterium]
MKRKAVGLLRQQNRVRFSFPYFTPLYSDLTSYLISRVLGAYQLTFLDNVALTLLREAIGNATKANLKRAYFREKKADIENPEVYAKVMEDFKSEAVMDSRRWLPAIEAYGLMVHLYLEMRPDSFRVVVENNVGITPVELSRIRSRLKLAEKMDSIAEAFEHGFDESEGAGIGLLLNLILLRKSGIGQKNFAIQSDGKRTRVSLTIPRNLQRPGVAEELGQRIADHVENLPTFPQAIQRVMDLCDNPDTGLPAIAREVERDPALAASILRLANSGGFISGARAESISRAVSVIGAKNVRQLALAHSSKQLLNSQFPIFQQFWTHAARCANYARGIAEACGQRKHGDVAYMGGLLHDIGKIILHAIDPAQAGEISALRIDRTDNSSSVLEEVAMGVSHAQVGGMLAERWSFGDPLPDVIRYHHSAFAAPAAASIAASAVHLADAFLRAEEGRASYVYFDQDAQLRLGLPDPAALQNLHEHLKTRFAGQEMQW